MAETHAPDDVYDVVCHNISEKEVVDLSFAIFAINAWNRLAIGFRMQPLVPKPAKAA